tara:strand:- start:318 stop:1436 length:1119 start_codon:yes stop_codon:yes gene_type:complete
MNKTFQNLAKKSKVIVIKVGSNILVNEKFKLRKKWLNSLVDDVAKLQKKGSKIIIVSSGAIALGRDVLQKKKLTNLHEKQAAASIGQIQLSQNWQRAFARSKIQSSQILITAEDLNERRKYLNIRNTIYSLLDLEVIPIINENDTTSTEEIRFGDNDKLSAMIANALSAELLILLSDVNGLYTSNPKKSSSASLLTSVSEIDQKIEKYVDQDLSEFGSGGMLAKVNAAKLCMQSGSTMIISNGLVNNPIDQIHPEKSTWFHPAKNILTSRQQWIWNRPIQKAIIHIDEGASRALGKNSSLLAIGVKSIEGRFYRGDTVSIHYNKKEVARGMINYDFKEMDQIKGKKSNEISTILGFVREDEIIHKDNMVASR